MKHTNNNWPLQRVLEVEWLDSCSTTRWESLSFYQQTADVSRCRSVGYLLRRDKHVIVLAQSISGTTDNVADAIAIPVKAVVKVRELKGGLG